MAIRLIFNIIDIVSAASVFNNRDRLLKIVSILDEYTFLIASDIRHVKMCIPRPLSSPDIAGAVKILYTLRYFVPLYMDY